LKWFSRKRQTKLASRIENRLKTGCEWKRLIYGDKGFYDMAEKNRHSAIFNYSNIPLDVSK